MVPKENKKRRCKRLGKMG